MSVETVPNLDEWERRVRCRFQSDRAEQIVQQCRSSGITQQMTEMVSAEDIAEDVQITTPEALCLILNDQDWTISAAEIFVQMRAKLGATAQGKVDGAWKILKNANNNLSKSDLRKMGLNELKVKNIPLCVRFWLQQNFLQLFECCQQESGAHTDSEALVVNDPSLDGGTVNHASATPTMEPGAASLIVESRSKHEEGMVDHPIQDTAESTAQAESQQDFSRSSDLKQLMQIKLASGDHCVAGLHGTVLHTLNEQAIALMDDHSLALISRDSHWEQVEREALPETLTSLIAAFCKGADSDNRCNSMVTKFYANSETELKYIAKASKIMTESGSNIQFLEVLGSGGYGFVISLQGIYSGNCVKIELDKSNIDYFNTALFREYRYISKKQRNLGDNTPRLKSCFKLSGTGTLVSFCQVISDSRRLSFLCMELLFPYVDSHFSGSTWMKSGAIPDTYRQIALEQSFVLFQLREAGCTHRDLKNQHWMQRITETGSQLVLIDYGLSESATDTYITSAPKKRNNSVKSGCKLTGVSPVCPSGENLLRLGGSRPGTIGFRPKHRSGSGQDYTGDIWSLAVGWCACLDVRPGTSKQECKEFEEKLYKAHHSLELFQQFIREETTSSLFSTSTWDRSVSQWLQLIFTALNCQDIKQLLYGGVLLYPFYKPSTLDRLRTCGIIVQHRNLKPVLMMHADVIGLIILCLLYYDIDELFAYYGGKLVVETGLKGGIEEVSFHNLPCGPAGILCGAVSKHFSLEDFAEKGCVASFIMSSNIEPSVSAPGTLHKADRYNPKPEGNMHVVPLRTRIPHAPGMQPTWPYNWNAGIGEPLYTKQKVEELKAAAKTNQVLSEHILQCVRKARQEVLLAGHTDSWLPLDRQPVSPIGSFEELCSSSASSALSQIKTDTHKGSTGPTSCQPLPEDLVRCIEQAALNSGEYPKMNIPDLEAMQRNSIFLENAQALTAKGILVLKQMPNIRTSELSEKMLSTPVFIDLTSLALKAAEHLREEFPTRLYGNLYERVCIDGPLNSDADQVFWGSETPSKQTGDDQSDRLRSANKDAKKDGTEPEKRKATKKGVLHVIKAFLTGMPPKAWKYIFQDRYANGSVSDGDKRRYQSKGHQWKDPAREDGESMDAYLDRVAGSIFLPAFMRDVHTAVTKVLPYHSSVCDCFKKDLIAAIASDATEGDVRLQISHMDKKPELRKFSFSSLFSLSDWMSHLGMLINSCTNTQGMLQFEKDEFKDFKKRFEITRSCSESNRLLADVLKGTSDEKLYFAWHHFFLHQKKPDQFMEMFGAYGAMPPLMMVLFNTDMIHWGPPYPMRPCERDMEHFLQIHLR